jgi:hypothetical protein
VEAFVAEAVEQYPGIAPVVSCFYAVRDLPYALDGSHDGLDLLVQRRGDCLAKSELLAMALAAKALGIPARYVRWRYLIPEAVPEVAELPSRVDLHRAVQLLVGGKWVLVDSTHHPGLRNTRLLVSEWDGQHDTQPGYRPLGPALIESLAPAAVRQACEEVRCWTASCPEAVAAWRARMPRGCGNTNDRCKWRFLRARSRRLQMTSNGLGEVGLGAVIDVEDAVLGHEGVELLLVVGHSWRQRRDVPVQVGVALLAAQAQGVHQFGRDGRGHRPGDSVHDALECQELLLG